MITKESCCAAICSLVDYGTEAGLLDELDRTYAENTLLRELGLDAMEAGEERFAFPACLEMLCDYAVETGKIEDTVTRRDLFDTLLMDALTPRPSTVIHRFRRLCEESPKAATDWFYKFSQDSNYIRRDRISRDIRWTVRGRYGELEISINLSKPEKDPRDIAAAGARKATGYPKCQLCAENEGYAGTLNHPARENHRIIPLELCGEKWGLQYSPYVYYNEHCIVLNTRHVPMVIDRSAMEKLFAFVERFPHYFLGSNADLPIVGGSILSHEHFQGGRYEFPMDRAAKDFDFTVPGFEDVDCAVLNYPLTVLRLNGENRGKVIDLAVRILDRWRDYSDTSACILAESGGEKHNTLNPIARMRNGRYELDLVLRNNLTTPEHPMGLYHPHEELHHIKKENIGLIEAMGLAILPGRLKGEMQLLKEALLQGEDIRSHDSLRKHADWAEEFLPRHPEWSADTADAILREEIGRVFEKVLECAGVFKRTEEGKAALRRFLSAISS
mgnify:CR=1 FL=1